MSTAYTFSDRAAKGGAGEEHRGRAGPNVKTEKRSPEERLTNGVILLINSSD